MTGLHRAIAPFAGGRGAILTFHRVRPRSAAAFAPNAHLEVTPEYLAAMVDRVRARGLDIVSLDEALERLAGPPRGRFVALTFDDGYRDNLEQALPVLKARGAPFAVYVATGFIDRTAEPWWMVLEEAVARSEAIAWAGGPPLAARSVAEKGKAFDRLLRWLVAMAPDEQSAAAAELGRRHGVSSRAILDEAFMDWGEVRRLAAEQLATIGGHTIAHHALARLPEARARAEISGGAERLRQQLGRAPRHFAYPYGYPGAVGERDYRLVADLGFATGARTSPGVLSDRNAARPTALPRISMNGHFQALGYLDVMLSGAPFIATDLVARLRGRRPQRAEAISASPSSG